MKNNTNKLTEDDVTRNFFKKMREFSRLNKYNMLLEEENPDIKNQEDLMKTQLGQNNASTNLRVLSFVKNENYTQMIGVVSNIQNEVSIEFDFRTDTNNPQIKLTNVENFFDLTESLTNTMNTILLYFQSSWKNTL